MNQSTNPDHTSILKGVIEQLRPVLEGSSQGIYVYLDEHHKDCNQRFADLLGYDSPADWNRPVSFTEQFVDPASRGTLVSTYQQAMTDQVASTIDVDWRKRDGGVVPTTVILVPIAQAGELMALHYVTPR